VAPYISAKSSFQFPQSSMLNTCHNDDYSWLIYVWLIWTAKLLLKTFVLSCSQSESTYFSRYVNNI
jgi:hypothetical protein